MEMETGVMGGDDGRGGGRVSEGGKGRSGQPGMDK